jgi:hypothetical protein
VRPPARVLPCLLAACLAAALAAGCRKKAPGPDGGGPSGPSRGEVTGTIKLADGTPLPGGWIAFHGPEAGDVVVAPVDRGQFKAVSVPVGDRVLVTVDVTTVGARARALEQRHQEAVERADLMKRAGRPPEDVSKRAEELKADLDALREMEKALKGARVDEKFARRETTTLSVAIKGGPQTVELALTP